MCLGFPGRIVAVEDRAKKLGVVDIDGGRRIINLACVLDDAAPEALIGEWVMVHRGLAMTRLDADEARRALELLAEMADLQKEMLALDGYES